jgi:hypothetical protein
MKKLILFVMVIGAVAAAIYTDMMWALLSTMADLFVGTWPYALAAFIGSLGTVLGLGLLRMGALDAPEMGDPTRQLPPDLRAASEELATKIRRVNAWGMEPSTTAAMRELCDSQALIKLGMPHTAALMLLVESVIPTPDPLASKPFRAPTTPPLVPKGVTVVTMGPLKLDGLKTPDGVYHCGYHFVPSGIDTPDFACPACGYAEELNAFGSHPGPVGPVGPVHGSATE